MHDNKLVLCTSATVLHVIIYCCGVTNCKLSPILCSKQHKKNKAKRNARLVTARREYSVKLADLCLFSLTSIDVAESDKGRDNQKIWSVRVFDKTNFEQSTWKLLNAPNAHGYSVVYLLSTTLKDNSMLTDVAD